MSKTKTHKTRGNDMTTAMINTNYKRIVTEQNLETGKYGTVERNFKGEICEVIEQFDNFVCLSVDGAAVDFGKSEIEMNPIDPIAELNNYGKNGMWHEIR